MPITMMAQRILGGACLSRKHAIAGALGVRASINQLHTRSQTVGVASSRLPILPAVYLQG